MLSIANYTADNGEAMFDAMSNEVNNFKELIKEIYANRNDAISELLKDEQRQMKSKYEKWTKETIRKSEETLEKIKEILPTFDMALFIADPSNYIYSAMMEVC
uniref:Ribosome-recycling factor, mitochondrial n=1 Tax=Lygus hesperus TaxID=30085 RepID=A0A146L685_LYGHE